MKLKPFIYKVLLSCLIATGLIFLYLYLNQKNITLSSFADCLFMVGLAYLCTGAFFAILSSGFFDVFQRSMKNFLKKKETVSVEDANLLSSRPSPLGLPYWFTVAGIFIFLSLLLPGLNR